MEKFVCGFAFLDDAAGYFWISQGEHVEMFVVKQAVNHETSYEQVECVPGTAVHPMMCVSTAHMR